MPTDYSANDKERFQQLYDLAVVSANESQENRFTRESDLDTDEDDSESAIFIIIVVVAVLALTTTAVIVGWIICRTKK